MSLLDIQRSCTGRCNPFLEATVRAWLVAVALIRSAVTKRRSSEGDGPSPPCSAWPSSRWSEPRHQLRAVSHREGPPAGRDDRPRSRPGLALIPRPVRANPATARSWSSASYDFQVLLGVPSHARHIRSCPAPGCDSCARRPVSERRLGANSRSSGLTFATQAECHQGITRSSIAGAKSGT
jgi:hypothetical protein